jgi:protein gp37
MASKIEWTEETWNPVVGCSIVSPGCTNCYAMKMAARLEAMGSAPHYAGTTMKTKAGAVWTGTVTGAPDSVLYAPLKRRKPTIYFVNSMGDLFHEAVTDEMIDRVFAVMALSRQHTFQILTKRAARMRQYMAGRSAKLARHMTEAFISLAPAVPTKGRALRTPWPVVQDRAADLFADPDRVVMSQWPLPNVWLGVSAEDQARWAERVPELLWTPAAKRFVSVEPMVGEIDPSVIDVQGGHFTVDPLRWDTDCEDDDGEDVPDVPPLDWIIVGGESGKSARPMHPDWARILRDACAEAGVAFFFKQWGEWAPGEANSLRKTLAVDGAHWFDDRWDFVRITAAEGAEMHCDDEPDVWKVGKRHSGRLLDGVEHNAMPEVTRG